MATVATFTTIHGRLIHQVKDGNATKFISDTLGSVIAEYDVNGGGISYAAEYWPYGEVRSESGTSDTSFGFVGVLGYMKDFDDRLYVRARYLRTRLARWQTVDPLWPRELAYSYVGGEAVRYVDPSGLTISFVLGCIAMLDCETHPGGPCAWAKMNGMVYDDIYGMVICCKGVKHACVYGLPEGAPPGVKECIEEHERTHFGHVKCEGDGPAMLDRNIITRDEAECEAYTVEILCLMETRRENCGKLTGWERAICMSRYRKWICDACGAARNHHGCSDLPSICKSCK